MKSNFQNLKKLIVSSDVDDFLIDHDFNIVVLNPDLKTAIKANLDLTQTKDVSRFLTMVICFLENDEIGNEMVDWSNDQYVEYLKSIDISDYEDDSLVIEFMNNFSDLTVA